MKRTLDLTPFPGEMLKPRELIDLRGTGPLTLQDRRVFNALVENAWGPKLGEGRHWFEVSTGALRDHTDRNSRLSDTVERLMRTIVMVTDADGNELRTPLLSSNVINTTENNGTLRYKFTEELAELIKDSTIFAKLDMAVMRSFSSKYAYSLYEAISRRVRQRYRFVQEMSLSDLRELLGVEEGKLDGFGNLNKFAIQPALVEVNGITPFIVTIAPKKTGRKVTHIVMSWAEKDTDGKKTAYAEMHRHRTGRKQRVTGEVDQVSAPPHIDND